MSVSKSIQRQLNSDDAGRLYGRVLRIPIGVGDESVARTIAAMKAIIDDAAWKPPVQQVAATLVANATNRAPLAQLAGLDAWIRDVVNFKRDTLGEEVLRHPTQLIHEITVNGRTACDCDDVAMLGASVIRAMGYRPFLRVVGRDAAGPFTHVHFGALVPLNGSPRLVPMDPQERIPMGTATPGARERAWWA